ncbi:DUF6088 family protein, partial [Arthrospira platensis SPKY1]|nr:DUF6088 family protein [Arthrospira platensis SPKY1]
MIIAKEIQNRIKHFPVGKPFGYRDLGIEKTHYRSASKALERLKKVGLIKSSSKGVFYRPQPSIFGELSPNPNDLLRLYLFENGRRVAYETGTSLYNRLGLTSQVAFRIKIASQSKRITINRGALQVDPVKSYVEVTDNNYALLGLLD